MSRKQCRPWSDATCGVWPGSTLFFSGLCIQKHRVNMVYQTPICIQRLCIIQVSFQHVKDTNWYGSRHAKEGFCDFANRKGYFSVHVRILVTVFTSRVEGRQRSIELSLRTEKGVMVLPGWESWYVSVLLVWTRRAVNSPNNLYTVSIIPRKNALS